MAPGGLRIEHAEGVCVVSLVGEHDMATVPVVQERVDALFAERRSVVLDFSEVEFLDSTVIRTVLHWSRAAQLSAIEAFAVVVGPVSGFAARTLRTVGVLPFLPVFSSRERAAEALAEGRKPRGERRVEVMTDPDLEAERLAALKESVEGRTARVRDIAAGRLRDVVHEQDQRKDDPSR